MWSRGVTRSFLTCPALLLLYVQHNKQREELHRLQEKHPEIVVKAALQSAGRQVSGTETAQQTDSSEDEDEVCQAPHQLKLTTGMTMHRNISECPSSMLNVPLHLSCITAIVLHKCLTCSHPRMASCQYA